MITLYHGSDTEIEEIDLAQSRINKDFGRGFYLSSDLDQARKFAKYKADNPESKTGTPVVTKFETEEATFTDGTLRIKRFDGYTLEWAQFIKENRKTRNTDYDIVIGPIANDDVKTQFARHLLGEITLEELMESLKWKRCTYQYCFISEEAIKRLKAIGKI